MVPIRLGVKIRYFTFSVICMIIIIFIALMKPSYSLNKQIYSYMSHNYTNHTNANGYVIGLQKISLQKLSLSGLCRSFELQV